MAGALGAGGATGFGAAGGITRCLPVGWGGLRGMAGCSNHAEARAAASATCSGLRSALGGGGGGGGGATGASCRTWARATADAVACDGEGVREGGALAGE
ncbi:MAG TPA: PE family protein, partial [Fibrobacteria bacterium]|nr:PE family protein [Fibrobacteria bacterium]